MNFCSLDSESRYLSDFLSLCKYGKIQLNSFNILVLPWKLGQQMFSVKGQVVNILGLWVTSDLLMFSLFFSFLLTPL